MMEPLAVSHPPKTPPGTVVDYKQKGYLMIRDVSTEGTYYILDMQVVKTDAASYVLNTPDKILLTVEWGGNVITWFVAFINSNIFPHSLYQ